MEHAGGGGMVTKEVEAKLSATYITIVGSAISP